MPQLIMTKGTPTIDGSVKKAVQSFFEKLTKDDTTPGLHIEPINGCVDERVRTGRVDKFYRAVLVRLQGGDDATYVYAGTFPHDKAIDYARRVRLTLNPVNGIPELEEMVAPRPNLPEGDAGERPQPAVPVAAPAPAQPEPGPAPVAVPTTGGSQPHHPILGVHGHTMDSLVALGIRPDIASRAMALRSEDALLEFADQLRPVWQGTLLVSLACGESAAEAMAALGLGGRPDDAEDLAEDEEAEDRASTAGASEDETILRAMHHPAAQLDFAVVEPTDEGMAEFFAVLEGGSFAQWRVFLHPQQRAYALRSRNGAFRLSGGAGTGKTVVLLHRARALHTKDPDARIVLTTFNRTLAGSLQEGLDLLDPTIPQVELGEPGVAVKGVDALVRQVLVTAGADLSKPGSGGRSPIAQIVGERSSPLLEVTSGRAWEDAVGTLVEPPAMLTPSSLEAEYSLVILPNRITTEDEYLRIRRPGRGVRLGRSDRRAVWKAIEAYRAHSAADGATDWDEKAMIAAVYLDSQVAAGVERPVDHVLVDEAQDLSPARLKFLRALVPEGKNDLFLAEDAHQRIYAPKVVLSHHGINIRGRSRRLTLNYRTTAQNLHWAVGVLSGIDFTDLSGEPVSMQGYRSARTGVHPLMRAYPTAAEEFEGVAQQIRNWQESDPQGQTIGLLCASRYRADRWVRELADRGVRAKFIGPNIKPPSGDDPTVAVMTLHRAKGMEFSKVALVGMTTDDAFGIGPRGTEDDEADAGLRQRSLLYVAATRARDELLVTWSGEPHMLVSTAHHTRTSTKCNPASTKDSGDSTGSPAPVRSLGAAKSRLIASRSDRRGRGKVEA